LGKEKKGICAVKKGDRNRLGAEGKNAGQVYFFGGKNRIGEIGSEGKKALAPAKTSVPPRRLRAKKEGKGDRHIFTTFST